MKALFLTREYPPHVYGGAGVAVDHLTRALSRLMAVEVRCFGPPAPTPPIVARGYEPWERLRGGPCEPRYSGALEALSVGLAMARDPVDADVAHAHTWYVALGLAGRCRVEERFGWDAIAALTHRVYADAVAAFREGEPKREAPEPML